MLANKNLHFVGSKQLKLNVEQTTTHRKLVLSVNKIYLFQSSTWYLHSPAWQGQKTRLLQRSSRYWSCTIAIMWLDSKRGLLFHIGRHTTLPIHYRTRKVHNFILDEFTGCYGDTGFLAGSMGIFCTVKNVGDGGGLPGSRILGLSPNNDSWLKTKQKWIDWN